MRQVGENRYEGDIRSTAGDYGEFATTLSGTRFTSDILWADGSYTTATGVPSADGTGWMVQDSLGCQSQLTRAGG